MRVYLFANPGLLSAEDVYGHKTTEASDSADTVKTCLEYINDPSHGLIGIECITAASPQEIIMKADTGDLVIAVQNSVYETIAGSGIRGYYRSTRYPNSERCKALAITVLKSVKDHSDLYYHGVYNELRDRHIDLTSVVKVRAVAAMIEIGYAAGDTRRHHRLKGIAIGRGILRYLNASRTIRRRIQSSEQTESTAR